MIGELVNCNNTFIHRENGKPAGRSDRASSFYKETGLTEDRFEAIFRGRLAFPRTRIATQGSLHIRLGSNDEKKQCQVFDMGNSAKSRKFIVKHEFVSPINAKKTVELGSGNAKYVRNSSSIENKTSNSEYGRICDAGSVPRAGLSSYVGYICKEITLEKVFH